MEPGKSKDDIFLSTAHDIEEVFLCNPFNVRVESAGIADCTCFVHGLVNIANSNGGSKFFCGKSVFSDKLPVYAGDICTGVY